MPGSREENFYRNNVFSIYNLYGHAPALEHQPLGVEKKISRKYAFSLYNLYGHAPAQEPLSRGHEIYNFGRPFFGQHYYTFSLYAPYTGVEKKTL